MDSYGLKMKGPFVVEFLSTLPSWEASDEGRIIYTEDTHKFYNATNVSWIEVGASRNGFWEAKTLIGGGSGALDSLDGALLSDKDGAIVSVQGDYEYNYVLNANSGATSNPPYIITPTTNAGNKRWILQGGLGFEYLNSSPSGNRVLGYNGYLYATRVYNAIYNDVADYFEVPEEIVVEYGKTYIYNGETALKSQDYCQIGILGIATDTYGFGVGKKNHNKQIPISVAGFVLAYVDKEYQSGTPLTSSSDGNLTEMIREDVSKYPERLVATYIKREPLLKWNDIEVNGRYWVKVK
jgi:hypothetical protein